MSLWECIHEDVLEHILDEIVLLSDYIRFGAVCKKWFRVFLQRKHHRIERCKNEVPLLLYSQLRKLSQSVMMFNIFDKRCYSSMSPLTSISQLNKTWGSGMKKGNTIILASSYGWLAILSMGWQDLIMLINPITGNTISLPTSPPEEKDTMWAVVLSCDPCIYPDKCVVAFVGDHGICITRLRGNKWTKFELNGRLVVSEQFHKGQLYALYRNRDLIAIDCLRESNNADNTDFGSCYVVMTTSPSDGFNATHLVESVNGELLMIANTKKYTDFKVYKLVTDDDENKMKGRWDQIYRLYDDQVLFCSDGNVICSKCRNLQPDSIYFIFGSKNKTSRRYSHRMLVVSLNEERKPKKESIELGVESKDGFYPWWVHPTLQ